jgi:dTDP-N-acetylfucosamine:lipid II N-acetylfucosaminyltransferase
MSTVHVFINANGVFIKKTMEYVEQIEPGKHFYFVEKGSTDGIPFEQLLKSRSHIEALVKKGQIRQVLFHSLHYYQFRWLRHLQRSYPEILISWMFWSFEYYQLSFEVAKLYAPFSQQFLTRKLLFNLWENAFNFFRGRSLTLLPISKSKYQRTIGGLNHFYSFNSVDFDRVFNFKQTVKYHFMSYLDASDLFVQSEQKNVKRRIMVGHNGSPLLNHLEVINYLSEINYQEEVLLPLNYGKADYISRLKLEILKFPQLNVQLLEKPMSMEEYYRYICDVEFFLLNSYCQQGLGNIIYFLFNDATVYLSDKSSSYHFFKGLGFSLKPMEELILGGALSPITNEEKKRNKQLVQDHFSREKVLEQWEGMLRI